MITGSANMKNLAHAPVQRPWVLVSERGRLQRELALPAA